MKHILILTLVLGAVMGATVGCQLMMSKEELKMAHENATIKGLVKLQAMIEVYNGPRSYADRLMDPRDLFGEMPKELITGSNKVVFEFDGTGGWFYDQKNRRLSINLEGEDHKGRPYIEWWRYWKES